MQFCYMYQVQFGGVQRLIASLKTHVADAAAPPPLPALHTAQLLQPITAHLQEVQYCPLLLGSLESRIVALGRGCLLALLIGLVPARHMLAAS